MAAKTSRKASTTQASSPVETEASTSAINDPITSDGTGEQDDEVGFTSLAGITPTEPATTTSETASEEDEEPAKVSSYGFQQWQVLNELSCDKEGWSKTTQVMKVGAGCLVQVHDCYRDPVTNLITSSSVAVTYVPGVRIEAHYEGIMLESIR